MFNAVGAFAPVSANDEFVWPTWAEKVLGRSIDKSKTRNFRILLDQLEAQKNFAGYRDVTRLELRYANLMLARTNEALEGGVPKGELASNFLTFKQDNTREALRFAYYATEDAQKALDLATEPEARAFMADVLQSLGAFLDTFPKVLDKLVELAQAAGFQLGRLSKEDEGLWSELSARFKKYMDQLPDLPKPPEFPAGLVLVLLLGLGALALGSRR